MKISRLAVCGFCLPVLLLWLPSSSGAVSSSILCQGLGNGLWGQWLDGTLPRTDVTIDKVQKVKNDCPQLAGSMGKIADGIKGHQQKQAGAKKTVKKSGEKYQSSAYDPGGIPRRSAPAAD